MKVALIVQRYGTEVVGGAELLTRQVAEKLVSELGWQVDVLTTTAIDYQTWREEYQPGSSQLNGVTVRRFPVTMQRNLPLFNFYNRFAARVLKRFARQSWFGVRELIEKLWYLLQGPRSPQLLKQIAKTADIYDAFIFSTYLYEPTVRGLPLVAKKSILVPCLHEEAPAYFSSTQRLLSLAPVFLLNTAAEQRLLNKLSPASVKRSRVAGIGFDLPTLPAKVARGQTPYILYLGRLSRGKNVDQLITMFEEYCRRHPAEQLELWLAGAQEKDWQLPNSLRVKYCGFVDDARKLELVAGARAVVNPSPLESLSIIAIEAMSLQVPLLLNGHCEVLRHYADNTATVEAYYSTEDFVRLLGKILKTDWQGDPVARERLVQTAAWARDQFSWQRVMNEYDTAVKSLQ